MNELVNQIMNNPNVRFQDPLASLMKEAQDGGGGATGGKPQIITGTWNSETTILPTPLQKASSQGSNLNPSELSSKKFNIQMI